MEQEEGWGIHVQYFIFSIHLLYSGFGDLPKKVTLIVVPHMVFRTNGKQEGKDNVLGGFMGILGNVVLTWTNSPDLVSMVKQAV